MEAIFAASWVRSVAARHGRDVAMKHRIIGRAICVAVAAGMCLPALAADWPQWRYDASRSAASPQELPDDLHLQWVRELPKPTPAWPRSQHKLQFDASYEPVVMGKMLYVASMVTDSVTAYDTDSGAEKWRFYTDGPVRFAPVGYKGRLYVASDDGHLYCLNAVTGSLIRKFSGAPAGRKVIGNHRLVSMWPARGGPALYDGKIYFAASIWPFMGVFIHALDAETGSVVWTNSGSGSIWMNQPHGGAVSFSAVAPQGYLAVAENRVIVPCGRAVPSAFDRKTGRFLYFHHTDGKMDGGYEVSIAGEWFVNGGKSYDLARGARGPGIPRGAATADAFYFSNGKEIVVTGLTPVRIQYKDRRGKMQTRVALKPLLKVAVEGAPERIYLKAGKRLYGASKDGSVTAAEADSAKISWKGKVEGAVWNMLAADGKLFVVTADGRIYCFGAKKGPARTYPIKRSGLEGASDRWAAGAKKMLAVCGQPKGYCISLGLGSGSLVTELLRQSDMHVIVIDPNAKKVHAFRRRMDSAGLYGTRVAAHVGDPFAFPLPPYVANLIVSEDLAAASMDTKKTSARAVFRPLRPYGGVACLPGGMEIADWASSAKLEGAEVSVSDGYVSLRRAGALSGSAWWTHQYGDAANTVVSADKLVKAPLGLLWFGGPPNDPILPRHGHGPSPQVAGGRLFIEGRDLMRCVDVYTGRVLWERKFKDLGVYHDNTNHQPGAGEIGGNYVSLADAVYVMYPDRCMLLDPATGKTTKEFKLPAGGGNVPRWGFIAVWRDLLIAAASPIRISSPKKGKKDGEAAPAALKDVPGVTINDKYSSAGKTLVVMNRHSGKVAWSREAKYGFRHNAIAAAAGKVFCIDGMSPPKLAYLKRRGYEPNAKPTLYAFNAGDGKVLWKTDQNVFGTFLNYSEQHDVLLQGGSRYRDRAGDEVGKAMVAYRGKDGKVLWKDPEISYGGPCMLWHDTIITNGSGGFRLDLLTGRPRPRKDPLTGRPVRWMWSRTYGCNTAVASEHLMTFRSGAAGYYDLRNDGGTGNLGGFKSGCTSNLIVADGVLSAPDYTRTCTCSYQNQSSLAMIHMPEAEMWTFSAFKWSGEPVRRVGINFGAPGDRLAENGTLWLDFPSVGGASPNVPVTVEGDKASYFRRHASLVSGGDLRWVAASGVEGPAAIAISLAKEDAKPRVFTVRLIFAEPDAKARLGDRVFSVTLQGKEALGNFDVAKSAGGPGRAIVREFKGVRVGRDLRITFKPAAGRPILCGVEAFLEN